MHFNVQLAALFSRRFPGAGSILRGSERNRCTTQTPSPSFVKDVPLACSAARKDLGLFGGGFAISSSQRRALKQDTVLRAALTVAAAAILVACGGGGGGGSDSSVASASVAHSAAASTPSEVDVASSSEDAEASAAAPATTQAVPDAMTLRTTDTAALRTAVLRTLQNERQRCGFNALTSDTSLDQAASSHSAYLANEISNGRTGSHSETPGTTGFTGETPTARTKAAGYDPRAVSEAFAHSTVTASDAAVANSPMPTDRAVSHTEFLLSTVYHMLVLLTPRPDLGIGYSEQRGKDLFTQVTVMEIGVKSNVSNSTQSDLLTYPCEGTTAARASFVPSKETPNPMPSVGSAAIGTPLYLRAPEGSVLVLTSRSIIGPTGNSVATTTLDSTNDPEQRLTKAQIFVLPQSTLTKGASYQVSFTGTIDGKAFSRIFNFKPA